LMVELCCSETRADEMCRLGSEAARQNEVADCNMATASNASCEDLSIFRSCCLSCRLGGLTRRMMSGDVRSPSLAIRQCHSIAAKIQPGQAEPFLECCLGEERDGGSSSGGSDSHSSATTNKCPQGFRYNRVLNVCDDVDECAEGLDDCIAGEETCHNTVGDYACQLKDYPDSSQQCPPGYRYFLVSCIDINECAEGTHNCNEPAETCANLDGGFECVSANPEPAPLCQAGYESGLDGECRDVNECATGEHTCLSSQRCDNTLGSFTCVRIAACGTGYTLNQDSGVCEDDDECTLGRHDCDSLGPTYKCRNTQGSFRCEKLRCDSGQVLDTNLGVCRAACQSGFEPALGSSSTGCVDINECVTSNPCSTGERCLNTPGSFECVSICGEGMSHNPRTQQCIDIDECQEGTARCYGGKICKNTVGSYKCECRFGYEESAETGTCQDIDECSNPFVYCGTESECQNTQGSYRCLCKEGFVEKQVTPSSNSRQNLHQGNNKQVVCEDVDECRSIPGICQHRCTNLWGSYRCHCRPGYRLSADKRSCVDIDECSEYSTGGTLRNFLCIGQCVNEPGSYRCTCPDGFILSANGHTCEDIDECADPALSPCRGESNFCFNTRGGYKCNDVSCPSGYEPERNRKNRCRLSEEARRCSPTDYDCIRRPVSLSFNFISMVSNMSIPNTRTGLPMFTMQSVAAYTVLTKFKLDLKHVQCPSADNEGVPTSDERVADDSFFLLSQPKNHKSVVSLVKPISGPQDILLELTMNMYHMGRFQASAVANIYIFVTPYVF